MAHGGHSRFAVALALYTLVSIILSILLVVDPLIDSPSGLIKLRWFTRTPVSHGLDACSWDYEGSWRIAVAKGDPDPLRLSFSSDPAITCGTISNATAVSFVADPFLVIPDPATVNASFIHVVSASAAKRDGAAFPTLGANGEPPSFLQPWLAFYEMKNLRRFTGELGTAISYDSGATWRHLGTALSERFHLSFPHVIYDPDSAQWLMFAETSGAHDGAIRIYGTTADKFPFGWRLVVSKRPEDPGWPETRRWFQFFAPAKYVDTAPIRFQNRWWIFTTRVGSPAAGQPKYTLLLFTAEKLLGNWTPHPSTLAGAPNPTAPAGGGRVPYGIDASRSTARSGGRPFVMNGTLYRWAQDCSRYYGEALVLMRADMANGTSYRESVAVRYDPTRDGRSWRAERLHHADMQQLPNGSWVGLLDGDRYADGRMHFIAREQWFVELKAMLRSLVPLQLAAVLLAVGLAKLSYLLAARAGWRGLSLGYGKNTGGGGGSRRIWSFSALESLGAPSGSSGGGSGGGASGGALVRNLRAVGFIVAVAVVVAVGFTAVAPWMVYCPRWPISVEPFPESPHFVPATPFKDPRAPYDVSRVAVITGCSSGFVDRLENLVASLQYWAPRTRLVVYDIGFTSQQLAEIRCWKGIELRRFPWERFPPHVRELSTYAFKPLTFQLALEEVSDVILWLDCGLEVRGPLKPVLDALSSHGHVSAQQKTSPGRQGWPLGHMAEDYMSPFFNLSKAEYERIKLQPFCAGGFQGYVRGSEAHRRILQPAAACSLQPDRCMAPPGHNRNQHCYDQTALTLLIRHNNFSSCLPRELFATSSTHKTTYDPRQTSAPIVVASRRYRKPKPYRGLLRRRSGCRADPARNPWVTVASEHIETTIHRASLLLTLQPYAAMIPDFLVQLGSCLGVHVLIQIVLWGQVFLLLSGISWRTLVPLRRASWPMRPTLTGGTAARGPAVVPPLLLVAAGSVATALVSVLVLELAGNIR